MHHLCSSPKSLQCPDGKVLSIEENVLFPVFEVLAELSEGGEFHDEHDGVDAAHTDESHDVPVLQSSHDPRLLHNLRLQHQTHCELTEEGKRPEPYSMFNFPFFFFFALRGKYRV